MSRVQRTSLTATGMPAKGPSAAPAERLRSTSRAAAIADSSAICVNALMSASVARIDASAADTICSAVSSPVACNRSSSVAESSGIFTAMFDNVGWEVAFAVQRILRRRRYPNPSSATNRAAGQSGVAAVDFGDRFDAAKPNAESASRFATRKIRIKSV